MIVISILRNILRRRSRVAKFWVVLNELFPKASVRVGPLPCSLYLIYGLMKRHFFIFHEVSYDKTGTPWDSSSTMNQYDPFFLLHLIDPKIGLLKVLLDSLFGKILDFETFISKMLISNKRSIKMSSTGHNSSNLPLLQNLFWSGSILIPQIDMFINLINFWKLISPCILEMLHQFDLLVHTFLANTIFIIII